MKIRLFFFLIYEFFDIEYESEIHFRWPEPENFDYPEKQKFRIIWNFRCLLRKMDIGF